MSEELGGWRRALLVLAATVTHLGVGMGLAWWSLADEVVYCGQFPDGCEGYMWMGPMLVAGAIGLTAGPVAAHVAATLLFRLAGGRPVADFAWNMAAAMLTGVALFVPVAVGTLAIPVPGYVMLTVFALVPALAVLCATGSDDSQTQSA